MVRIDKDYVFDGPDGKVSLLDLFDGRRQLILYHFMYAPRWRAGRRRAARAARCSPTRSATSRTSTPATRRSCSCRVRRSTRLLAYRERMGWALPWYSSAASDFNDDFGLTTPEYETFGLSVFLRDGDDIYRTYFTDRRGVEPLGSVWSFLDLTPLGRQETWEDSPDGLAADRAVHVVAPARRVRDA